ncbi:hypothetical protein HDU96_010919 [Phlyctochytrium bullatum]|nr:hypothetical protein HDU96_010919 [Phlyctochytrium bullatum]
MAAIWVPVKAFWTLGVIGAIAYLAKQRMYLDATALFDLTTPAEYAARQIVCTNTQYRSLDGRCTDLQNSAMGAVGIQFGKNIHPSKSPNVTEEYILSPNPRDVAKALFQRADFKPATSINLLAAAHIQFQTHDWFSHGIADPKEDRRAGKKPIAVPIKRGDPFFDDRKPEPQYYAVGRTKTYKNMVSHWWDLSQIYGTDARTALLVRSFKGGKLRVDHRNRIPYGFDGIEVTGFKNNWWAGLSLMHNIWTREHNSIADMLANKYPRWSDEKIFQTARLIACALNAKIHTIEWTPALLNTDFLKVGMGVNWWGKVPKFLDPMVPAQLRPFIAPLVGRPTNFDGVNFTLTEEFVSVYRMHPLLPDQITVRDHKTNSTTRTYNTAQTAFTGSRLFMDVNGIDNVLFTFGTSYPGALELNNYPNFLTHLRTPVGTLDMATIDLIRDRERGVVRYKEFRRNMAMTVPASIKDISDNPATVAALEAVYGVEGIDKVDLLVGCLAESPRPTGFAFGETAFTLFLLMASRRLKTDRFFTTDFTPAIYTQEGIDWVQNSSMHDVLKRNFPEVAVHAASVDNVFKPWKFNGAPVERDNLGSLERDNTLIRYRSLLQSVVGAIAYLARQRMYLEETALFDLTTPAEYASMQIACTNTRYRSLDGRPWAPWEFSLGETSTIESPVVTEEYILSPNPRKVATALLERMEFKPAEDKMSGSAPIRVPITPGDPLFKHDKPQPQHIEVGRTKTYKNMVSHWWDLSQIYGTDPEIASRVRSFKDGKLKVDH